MELYEIMINYNLRVLLFLMGFDNFIHKIYLIF